MLHWCALLSHSLLSSFYVQLPYPTSWALEQYMGVLTGSSKGSWASLGGRWSFRIIHFPALFSQNILATEVRYRQSCQHCFCGELPHTQVYWNHVSNLLMQYETTGRQDLVRHLVQMDPSYSNSSMRLKLNLFAFFFRISELILRITVLFGVLKALKYKTSMPPAVMFLSFGGSQSAVTKEEIKKRKPLLRETGSP